MEGVLNVDKPEGMTSHDVVQRVRRVSGVRRIGHTGTLDPLATGVLVLCIGRATRLSEYLLEQAKTYETSVRLGQTTTTYDAEGEVVAERPIAVDEATIAAALEAFRGEIAQRPPAYSAVKQDGVPLYKLARQGVAVERPLRHVTVYALELLAWREPLLDLRVHCSSGTYIRALAHDLGEALGCGGYVTALRRTAVGAFRADESVPLETLQADTWQTHLLPGDAAVAHLPRLAVTAEEATDLLNGRRLPRQSEQPEATLARAYAPDGTFLGVVAAEDEAWQPRKMFLPES